MVTPSMVQTGRSTHLNTDAFKCLSSREPLSRRNRPGIRQWHSDGGTRSLRVVRSTTEKRDHPEPGKCGGAYSFRGGGAPRRVTPPTPPYPLVWLLCQLNLCVGGYSPRACDVACACARVVGVTSLLVLVWCWCTLGNTRVIVPLDGTLRAQRLLRLFGRLLSRVRVRACCAGLARFFPNCFAECLDFGETSAHYRPSA